MPTLDTMLRSSLWAQTLDDDELDRVVHESHERTVGVGGYAMRRGEPADQWIGVIDGLVKMSVSQPDGRVSTFTGVTAGGWAGEGSLLKPGVWRYDGVAVRPTRLACVPRHTFERLVSTHLAFNRFLLSHLNARLSLFIGTLEHDRLVDTDARVAHGLASLFNADLYPTMPRRVSLGQREIGLLANVSRQRVNVALQRLQDLGLVRVEKGGVVVLDVDGLRDFAG